jgi:hypothetical protein
MVYTALNWKLNKPAKIPPLAYWSAVMGIFAVATWLRFRLPMTPMVDPDTWGYLSPAVNKLSGLGFTHSLRNYFYPGFTYLILGLFRDFRAISVVQHLLGLAAGVVLLLIWRRIWFFIPEPRLPPQLHSVIGLGLVFTYLLSPEVMRFEADLRPEGVASFVVALNIFVVVEFWYRCFIRPKAELSATLGALSVVSSIAVVLAKPSFAIAAIGAFVPVITAVWSEFALRRKLALISVSATAATLLILPAQLPARSDPKNQEFLPTQLFVIHADIICDQMAKDAQNATPGPYPRDWLWRIQRLLTAELARARDEGHYWRALGFNANYLMYDRTSIVAKLREEFGGDTIRIRKFYLYYYTRVWLQQPGSMMAKVARELLVFYSRECPSYSIQKYRSLSDEYRRSLSVIEEAHLSGVWFNFNPFRQLLAQTMTLASGDCVIRVAKLLRRWDKLLAITYLPAVLIAGAAAAAIAMQHELRRRFAALAALVLLLCWYNFGANLEVAIVHSLDDPRYKTIQLISTVLAQFVAFLLIGSLLQQAISMLRKRADHADSA